jgi:alkylation response protein AidB-like acyl-CoA dehydrogenase
MNFDFTDDQQAIKRTAHDLLEQRFKPEAVRALADGARYDDAHWRELCELGWAGIFIDEEHGGQGLGVVELVILLEELGYALAPVPFLSNAAAGLALRHAGGDGLRSRWLPGIASGEERGTVGMVRDGVAALVPDADSATVIVLFDDGEGSVHEAATCEIEPVETIDATRRFARVRATGDGESLGDVVPAWGRIATAIAAELVGVSQRAMEMAVSYARERKQFDRPIGAYQAVSHQCADMLRQVESARSTTYWAGWAADSEPETLALAAAMAKAGASDSGWNVTASALQVLGGIGFTWEHDLHFFLKRAKVDGALFGSAREHRERVAELSGLGAAAAPAPA